LELGWGDVVISDEELLGSFDCMAPPDVLEKIEAEFGRGDAVWLFLYNKESRLCFEEVLVPP
jgi:gamma-glutamylcyclotransferase (GGCT)/AIG2-like uncharacterized protein YtfP